MEIYVMSGIFDINNEEFSKRREACLIVYAWFWLG